MEEYKAKFMLYNKIYYIKNCYKVIKGHKFYIIELLQREK